MRPRRDQSHSARTAYCPELIIRRAPPLSSPRLFVSMISLILFSASNTRMPYSSTGTSAVNSARSARCVSAVLPSSPDTAALRRFNVDGNTNGTSPFMIKM